MLECINKTGFVPVVVINKVETSVPTAKALLEGGINFMEITFRTACAEEAIKEVAINVPDMIVGAGTVINVDQAKRAVEAGAKFIVSPGLSESVVIWCNENNIPVLPGCVTPSEIMKAMELGLKVVKFFPANIYGGLKAIKALGGPFPGIKFLPTGGVSLENLNEFASNSKIIAVGGSFVCPSKDIDEGNYDEITSLSREAIRIINESRS